MTDLKTSNIESFHIYCVGQGYSLFGIEHCSQRFSGNSITSNHGIAAQSYCNYAYSTKQNELCGGFWRIGIYNIQASSSSHMSSTSSKPNSTINSIPKSLSITSSSAISSTVSSTASSVASSVTSSVGSSATIDSLRVSYVGCYIDSSNRALSDCMRDTTATVLKILKPTLLAKGIACFMSSTAPQCFCGNSITTGYGFVVWCLIAIMRALAPNHKSVVDIGESACTVSRMVLRAHPPRKASLCLPQAVVFKLPRPWQKAVSPAQPATAPCRSTPPSPPMATRLAQPLCPPTAPSSAAATVLVLPLQSLVLPPILLVPYTQVATRMPPPVPSL